MCLVLLALDRVPTHRLVLAANRDEFHERPADPLHWWPDRDGIAGGRDRRALGTWLAASMGGRFGAVLNDRSFPVPPAAPSRGEIVPGFLEAADPGAAAAALQAGAAAYAGFHFLGGTPGRAWYCARGAAQPVSLGPGVHSADNSGLDVADPRLRRGRMLFARALERGVDDDALLEVLADRTQPGEGDGDRRPVFIDDPVFGTRCSSILLVAADGAVHLRERRFDRAGGVVGDTALDWHRHAATTERE